MVWLSVKQGVILIVNVVVWVCNEFHGVAQTLNLCGWINCVAATNQFSVWVRMIENDRNRSNNQFDVLLTVKVRTRAFKSPFWLIIGSCQHFTITNKQESTNTNTIRWTTITTTRGKGDDLTYNNNNNNNNK